MPAGSRRQPRALSGELDAVDRRLARLDRRVALAEWAMYTGVGRDARACEQVHLDRADFLRDPARLRLAERLLREEPTPALARAGELLRRAVVDAEVEQTRAVVRLRSRLQARVVRFRPRWGKRRVDRAVVHEALWRSADRAERRRAWLAEEPLRRSLEAPLRELISLRNDLARAQGFRTYADLRLSLEQLTPRTVRSLGHAAIAPLAGHVRRLREELEDRSGLSGWAPWDLHWALEQRAGLPRGRFPGSRMVPAVGAALGAWGLPEARRRFRVVRCDLPFGGLTIAVRVPRDVRVLVHPRGGWEYYWVLFHELGHAVHLSSVRAASHLERTLEPGYAAFSEGIATVFEGIADDENWLASRPGVAPELAARFATARRAAPVFYAASYLLGLELELRLYERPDRDPTATVHALARRWLGYDSHRPGSWADPFRVTHPVYLQSYLLAFLFSAQTTEAMLRSTERPLWPNPRAAAWLSRSYFADGARRDWLEMVRDATGAPLSAAAFVRSVGRAG